MTSKNGNTKGHIKVTTWTLYWRTGEKEVIEGETFPKAYFGKGLDVERLLDLIAALEGVDNSYIWCSASKQWIVNLAEVL